MNSFVIRESRGVMARHARSFQWAARFLPPEHRDAAAVVYAFCRLVDDLVDEHDDAAGLDAVDEELTGAKKARPLVAAFLEICEQRSIAVASARQLIAGVRSDLGEVRFKDDVELLRYCYRVAGTVGLMMCGVLGVRERYAHAHAIDLGVAMQLTNICRDVLEDSRVGRVYLPAERLARVGVDHDAILDGTADRTAITRVVRDLLALADQYYGSAAAGFCYIPARSRLAILIASRLYRSIGVELLTRHDADPMHGRTRVHWTRKAVLVSTSVGRFVSPWAMPQRRPHNPALHRALRGLPGTRN